MRRLPQAIWQEPCPVGGFPMGCGTGCRPALAQFWDSSRESAPRSRNPCSLTGYFFPSFVLDFFLIEVTGDQILRHPVHKQDRIYCQLKARTEQGQSARQLCDSSGTGYRIPNLKSVSTQDSLVDGLQQVKTNTKKILRQSVHCVRNHCA